MSMPNGTDNPAVTTPRWTDDVEEAAALALFRKWSSEDDWPDHVLAASVRATWRRMAATTLSLLAEAGLLLPPGGTTREQWSATLKANNGFLLPVSEVYQPKRRREDAESEVETLAEDTRDLRSKLTAVLVRRTVTVWKNGAEWRGPWTEVQP